MTTTDDLFEIADTLRDLHGDLQATADEVDAVLSATEDADDEEAADAVEELRDVAHAAARDLDEVVQRLRDL